MQNGMERANLPLSGRKALVTGASSGIGEAVALALGEAGADVAVNYVSKEEEAAMFRRVLGEFGNRCGSPPTRPTTWWALRFSWTAG